MDVTDTFNFLVRDADFVPVAGAKIRISFEAGRPFGPWRLITDRTGQARLKVRPRVARQVSGVRSDDQLLTYASIIDYVVEAEGFLPYRGRAELTDDWQAFSRPEFAATMNRRPKNKSLLITPVLTRLSDLMAQDEAEAPEARVVAAGLPGLWRSWSVSGRFSPIKGAWGAEARRGGFYLKAGVELPGPVASLNDVAVYRIFAGQFLPLMADLAAVYAPVVDGWDVTVLIKLQPSKDPYAMPKLIPLRLVFSERIRRSAAQRDGGLNRLIREAEVCSLAGKVWDPIERLEKKEAQTGFAWEWLAPLLAPDEG